MSQLAPALNTSPPAAASVIPGSLREEMEKRRAAGQTFDVRETIAIGVPLCTRLDELHATGVRLFVYPSIITYAYNNLEIMQDRMHAAPVLSRDRACLAPEERKGAEGDACGSVFAVGAILYELL